MRDDIHKGAPVQRRWQTVVRDCTRNADWIDIAPARAETALISELRGALRPSFLAALGARLYGGRQLEITKPRVDPREFRLMAKSRIEQLIVNHTLVALSRGATRREAHEQGVKGAIGEFKESMCRAVEAHAFEKAPRQARLLTERLRYAVENAGQSLAPILLEGRLPEKPVRAKSDPSLDLALPVKGGRRGTRAKRG